MGQREAIQSAATELGIVVQGKTHALPKEVLVEKINALLNHDFQKLVSILYRMDVSETRLVQLLKENPGENAAVIIADLMIERQLQKIKSRGENKNTDIIPDDDKW
jgi:hypothetical protein